MSSVQPTHTAKIAMTSRSNPSIVGPGERLTCEVQLRYTQCVRL